MNVFRTRLPLLLIVLILTAGCLSIPCYFIYMNAKGVIVDELGNNAIDIAASVAAFIEKDIDEYSELPVQSFSLPNSDESEQSPAPEPSATKAPQTSGLGSSLSGEGAAPPDDTSSYTDNGGVYDSGYTDGYNNGYDDGYDDGYDGFSNAYSDGTYSSGSNGGSTYDDGYNDGYSDGYHDGYFDGAYDSSPDDSSSDTATPGDITNDDSTSGNASYDDATYSSDTSETLKSGSGSSPISAASLPHAPQDNKSSYNETYFNEIIVLLEKIQRETGAAKIYTEKRLSDTKKGYVFKENYIPENRFLSGDLTEEEILAFSEGVNASTNILQDAALGEYIKGYAPIIAIKTNKPVGVVVVEFALADAVKLTSEILILIISCFVALTFLAAFVVYRLCISRMKYLSTDVLTELGNKRYFESSLKREIRFARRIKRPLSLMMIDVDLFKGINDSKGHLTGDMVLKAVSGMLLKCTRRSDICCRYGGDEFVVLLPGTDRMQAAAIAERIRQEVCALRFESQNGDFGVTLSIGVTELCDNMTAEKFKEYADKTLYYSKNTGKNRITVFNNTQNISI